MSINVFDIDNYNFNLPKNLIAQTPIKPADRCKLLFYDKGKIKDFIFKDIINLINENSVIFFNNTKVLKARLSLKNVKIINNNGKESILKKGEIFFLDKIDDNNFRALVYPGKKFKIGNTIKFNTGVEFKIKQIIPNGRIITTPVSVNKLFDKFGQTPLPPYIKYNKSKEKNYQSIFAKKKGSIAAPTASLHFTKNLLEKLKQKGIIFEYLTLHIGLGTFKSIDVKNIKKFNIHQEKIEINFDIFEKITNYKILGKNIIATGTTSVRTLETLPYLWKFCKNDIQKNWKIDNKIIQFWDELTKKITKKQASKIINDLKIINNNFLFNTKLFIYPGFEFKIINQLITNFHLPKSSLLVLVGAFMGYENMMKTYKYAIKKKYRFFSFGDAMYIKIN